MGGLASMAVLSSAWGQGPRGPRGRSAASANAYLRVSTVTSHRQAITSRARGGDVPWPRTEDVAAALNPHGNRGCPHPNPVATCPLPATPPGTGAGGAPCDVPALSPSSSNSSRGGGPSSGVMGAHCLARLSSPRCPPVTSSSAGTPVFSPVGRRASVSPGAAKEGRRRAGVEA